MLKSLWRRAGAARVSVVVPLYNHAAYIGDAIGSILSQGALVKEVLVVDDGSTDDSAAVMERLARQDQRIRFDRQANRGAHVTINSALARCSGELVAILNSDDAYLPGRLSILTGALDADSDADIAASGIQFIDGGGAAIENAWYEEALAFYRAGTDLEVALLNGNFLMTTSNLLFRRVAMEVVGSFAALRYAHDLDWLLRALALGRQIALVDEPLLRYRIHESNTISEDHSRVRAEWAIVAAAYLTTLWDRPGAPPISWDHAGSVQSLLRQHRLDRAVTPCMAYLRQHGTATLDRSPLLADERFKNLVRSWI